MDTLHGLDDRLFADVNDLARHSSRLHGAVPGYAKNGVVLFVALLLTGVLLRPTAANRALAAAGWAPLAALLAVTPLTVLGGRPRTRPGLRRTFPAPVSLPGTWEPMAVGTLAA